MSTYTSSTYTSSTHTSSTPTRPGPRALDRAWLLLVGLTLGAVLLGEGGESGLAVTLAVAAITAYKGRLVIERFLEIEHAHPAIRRLVRIYALLVPVLMVTVYLLGPSQAVPTGIR